MDPQLLIVSGILAVTVVLIITEVFRIDVVAVMAMLALAWTGSITAEEARSGFSSNAVLAIIGVMVMGRGLYTSGITEQIASFILTIAGRSKQRILATVSLTVGTMSGFMQNIGAAALFLPVMTGISKREKIPVSSLLMPMGFAALLGGTLTMVGTSSLIILNDLLANRGLDTFGLFAVMPIGITLLAVGILYFVLVGDRVFPQTTPDDEDASSGQKLLNVWGLSDTVFTFRLTEDSPLAGQTLLESDMGRRFNVNLLRVYDDDGEYDVLDDVTFSAGQRLVVQGQTSDVRRFAEATDLELIDEEERSEKPDGSGYLEVVIPIRSNLIGRTLREVGLRERHNAQVVRFFSNSEVIDEDVADRKIRAGDTLVLHGPWESLRYFEESESFITVTPIDHEPKSPEKAGLAVSSFAGAIAAVLLLDLPISIGFLTGALAMILTGVVSIEEAYQSIEWKVIFLISGLIPIGIAMEASGTAALLAEGLVAAVEGLPAYVILLLLGALMTVFSLIMSNVAATVLMVPLVLQLSGIGGLTSQVLTLQVGLCAANSFLIPTHHVNALLMTPGGYQVNDYLRAGGILSGLFILISTSILYVFYL